MIFGKDEGLVSAWYYSIGNKKGQKKRALGLVNENGMMMWIKINITSWADALFYYKSPGRDSGWTCLCISMACVNMHKARKGCMFRCNQACFWLGVKNKPLYKDRVVDRVHVETDRE